MSTYSEGYVDGYLDGQTEELADILVYLEANYDCEDILSDLRLRRDAVEAWA